MYPRVRPADEAAIAEAAHILRAGGLVAFPTETVYGLGADATNGRAVARVFEAKGRPHFNPLIVHMRHRNEAEHHAVFNPRARALADAFWPGALTLVLPRTQNCRLSDLVSAGLETVALRVPSHPVASALIAASERPLAAPSANASGRITATTAAHVAQGLGTRVDMILDGGATPLGLESSVVGFAGERPILLRAGSIPRDRLEAVVGPLAAPSDARVLSPGQLASHYAPRATLRLDAQDAQGDETLLGFGPNAPRAALNLSASGDLREAAANLFAMLHELDARGVRSIAVMPIPRTGLGETINDRLARAASPREAP
jgi:L-threonylcarbamoyladenylate synthase